MAVEDHVTLKVTATTEEDATSHRAVRPEPKERYGNQQRPSQPRPHQDHAPRSEDTDPANHPGSLFSPDLITLGEGRFRGYGVAVRCLDLAPRTKGMSCIR